MIITDVKHEEIIADDEGLEGGMDLSNLSVMFNILSEGFYSRRIDSIVREITSNCFDSHAEAQTDEPVLIENRYDVENDNYNIVFKDVGMGLSPERIDTIYLKWFSSTKRDSNDFIGGFGLGSKSPFSYTESFFITTWHGGLKYEYVFSKGVKLPQLISLYGYDIIQVPVQAVNEKGEKIEVLKSKKIPIGVPSEEHAGTEIIIPLKKKSDLELFNNSIKTELCYFDNVYCLNFPSVDNGYSIYRKKTFLYRPHGNYSNKLHLVLGKVCYPINFGKLGINSIDLPFGLTFEIGDFQVTPNREDVIYSDETIELIKNKIAEYLLEVQELVTLGSSLEETDDLYYYMNNRNRKPSISFDNNKVFIPVDLLEFRPTLVFKPLKHLPIAIPNSPFFFMESVGRVEGETFESHTHSNISWQDYLPNIVLRDIPFNKNNNLFLSTTYGGRVTIYKSNKLRKSNYREYCQFLGLYIYNRPSSWELSSIKRPANADDAYTYTKKDNGFKRNELVLNKVKIIKEYITIMYDYIQTRAKMYSDFTPTDEWILDYKEKRKLESKAYARKLNREIIIREFGYRQTVKLADLANCDILIYALPEDSSKLNEVKTKLKCIKSLVNTRAKSKVIYRNVKGQKDKQKFIIEKDYGAFKRSYRFIEIAKTNLPFIKDIPQLVNVNTVLKDPIFKKYDTLKATYEYYCSFWWKDSREIRKSKFYNTILKNIEERTFKKFFNYENYKVPLFTTKDKEIVSEINALNEQFKNVELFNYLSYDTPTNLLNKVVKGSKVTKLPSSWYGGTPVIEQKKEKLVLETIII